MSNYTYCTRIFEPYFAYLQAERQMGSQPALKSLIDAIGYDHLIMRREEDFEKVYPLRTPYYRYNTYIAVLTLQEGTYNCATFIDGIHEETFDMLTKEEKAKEFFELAKGKLTVIDFFNGKELTPNYDAVQQYIKKMIAVDQEYKDHSKVIKEYKQRLNEIKKEGEVLYATNPSGCYKSAINTMDDFISTTDVLFGHKHRQTVKELESFLACDPALYSEVKMFGLYLYAINFAISNKRFLKRGTKGLALNFNQTISQMREFIAENEGVIDKYIDYMNLTRNERENLMYLLTEEDLIANASKYVGDELFA